MSERLVQIAVCADDTERDSIGAALRIAGIEHVVQRRSDGKLGYEVRVREDDSDRAEEIVNDLYGVSARETVIDVEPQPPAIVCDNCGSTDVARTPKLAFLLLGGVIAVGAVAISSDPFSPVLFFLMASLAILLLVSDTWRCRDCGNGWK
jgi:hypothetical protein